MNNFTAPSANLTEHFIFARHCDLISAMHKFVSFNHRFISAESAALSAISSAALYGKGIFTTLAVYDSKPFVWEKHRERLTRNAEKCGIELAEFSVEKIKKSLLEIISKNRIENARARITIFDESAGGIWSFATNKKTHTLITTADLRAVSKDFRLTVSPFHINSTSPLAGIKSCNYLENILALEQAHAENFDEAIRLNERGEIVSACMANVFWIKNGQIYTPPVETGCIPGTTRSYIAENFAVAEKKARLPELIEADSVFLTSAGIGIVKLANLNEKTFESSPQIYRNIKVLFENSIR